MKNNKGFSLVELIIVIAIMAVLIGVLAPQYLRYVEKSKKQADLSAVGQVYDAVKVACSDPELQKALSTGIAAIGDTKDVQIGNTKGPSGNGGWTSTLPATVNADINKTVASNSIKLSSNTYSGSTFTVTVKKTTDGFEVTRDTAWQTVMNAQ